MSRIRNYNPRKMGNLLAMKAWHRKTVNGSIFPKERERKKEGNKDGWKEGRGGGGRGRREEEGRNEGEGQRRNGREGGMKELRE